MKRLLLRWLLNAAIVRLEPGDLLVVETAAGVRPEVAQKMAQALRSVLPVGVRALIVPKGTHVGKYLGDTAGTVPERPPPA